MAYKSQNNEAEIAINYFNGFIGRLLDIGANDGVTFSNSYDLIKLGWSAELIEPVAGAYDALKETHVNSSNVLTYNIGIGEKTEDKLMYIPDDTLIATTNNEMLLKWKHTHGNTKVISVSFYSFLDFTQRFYCYPKYDFITIDAEGSDIDILLQMDLEELGCKCICIEHGNQIEQIKTYCARFGLTKELLYNGENIIIAK